MPVVGPPTVRDGSLSIETNGIHKGVVQITLDDGRLFEQPARGADATDWSNKILSVGAMLHQRAKEQDAREQVDEDIAADHKEASVKDRAVAAIRVVLDLRGSRDPKDLQRAKNILVKINTYRVNAGLSPAQVAAHLAEAGLEPNEWDEALALFQLLNPADVAIDTAITNIQNAEVTLAALFNSPEWNG